MDWYPNPVSHDFVLMRTNVNLLNRVPEHDSPTFFVLHRTKVNQCILNGSVLRQLTCSTKRYERERERERGRDRERERESEREASERVCADNSAP